MTRPRRPRSPRDSTLHGMEISGGSGTHFREYQLQRPSDGLLLASIVVTNSDPPPGFTANREYWKFETNPQGNPLLNGADPVALKVTKEGDGNNTPSFPANQADDDFPRTGFVELDAGAPIYGSGVDHYAPVGKAFALGIEFGTGTSLVNLGWLQPEDDGDIGDDWAVGHTVTLGIRSVTHAEMPWGGIDVSSS